MAAIKIFKRFRELLDVTWSAIADGQVIKRSGTSLIGVDLPAATPPAPDPGYFQYNNTGAFGAVETVDGAYAHFDGTIVAISGNTDGSPDLQVHYPWMFEPVITGEFVDGVRLISQFDGGLTNQATGTNTRTNVSFAPNGTVANYPTLFSFFGTDALADAINYETIFVTTKGSADTYHAICSFAAGTGTRRPLNIEANGSIGATAQLVLGTDNGVSVGTGTQAGATNLLVAGTITSSNLSGTNTGDQTSITGISGTKAQFDTACSDGDFLYVGDLTQYVAPRSITSDYTVPANNSLVVAGSTFTIGAGDALTLASGAVMKIL